MHKHTVLLKGLILLIVILSSSTCNPTHALMSPLHSYQVPLNENLCLGINHYPQECLIDMIPYTRLCNNNASGISTPPPTPVPLQPITRPSPAPPGSITVPTSGKMLHVDQSLQVMRVFENDVEIRTIPVSTGLRMSYTPEFEGQISYYVNKFYSFGRHAEHAWYITKATGNIYIHSCPYSIIDGQKQYEGLEWLGEKPSSHGCVRIHPSDAEWLLGWDPRGVSLVITPPDFDKYPD